MLRTCTASLMHSNAALFVSLHKTHLTSNWKKTRKWKARVRECIHFRLSFPFPDYGMLGGEEGYRRKLGFRVVLAGACGDSGHKKAPLLGHKCVVLYRYLLFVLPRYSHSLAPWGVKVEWMHCQLSDIQGKRWIAQRKGKKKRTLQTVYTVCKLG